MGIDRFVLLCLLRAWTARSFTDLTLEEGRRLSVEDATAWLATIFLAAPTSTDARLKAIAKDSSGFIYAGFAFGGHGARKEMSGDAKDLVRRLRKTYQASYCGWFRHFHGRSIHSSFKIR